MFKPCNLYKKNVQNYIFIITILRFVEFVKIYGKMKNNGWTFFSYIDYNS